VSFSYYQTAVEAHQPTVSMSAIVGCQKHTHKYRLQQLIQTHLFPG